MITEVPPKGQVWKRVWILQVRDSFLESPGNFTGPKSNIQIQI